VRIPDGSRYAIVRGKTVLLLDAAPWEGGKPSGVALGLDPALLDCPVAPSKIVCVGRNYAAHAAELGNAVPKLPLWFMKPPSALLAPGGNVELPTQSERVEHEAELAVVIGRRARRVSPERALEHVFGYTIACDVTARDLQKSDGQWTRAKGFDTFCPVGPFIVAGVEPGSLGIRLTVNGQPRQSGSTRHMVFKLAELIAHLSSVMTLEPGDLMLTGTPEGVGPLTSGDRVRIEIDELGALEFGVVGPR
jgi:2-keto-4-pentenoate hydratase/2-oxohepta-3-ene-1,7-dioic acid hydratase in catechol pathway